MSQRCDVRLVARVLCLLAILFNFAGYDPSAAGTGAEVYTGQSQHVVGGATETVTMVDSDQYVIVYTASNVGGGTCNVTLPSIATCKAKTLYVFAEHQYATGSPSLTVTVDAYGSETIDGSTSSITSGAISKGNKALVVLYQNDAATGWLSWGGGGGFASKADGAP